jgi:hypothetical protein
VLVCWCVLVLLGAGVVEGGGVAAWRRARLLPRWLLQALLLLPLLQARRTLRWQ